MWSCFISAFDILHLNLHPFNASEYQEKASATKNSVARVYAWDQLCCAEMTFTHLLHLIYLAFVRYRPADVR